MTPKRFRDRREEFFLLAQPIWLSGGVPLIVVEAAYQDRQLGAEFRPLVDSEPVAQGMQHSGEHAIGPSAIQPGLRHDLFEPGIGGLHRLVKYFEAGYSHAIVLSPR